MLAPQKVMIAKIAIRIRPPRPYKNNESDHFVKRTRAGPKVAR